MIVKKKMDDLVSERDQRILNKMTDIIWVKGEYHATVSKQQSMAVILDMKRQWNKLQNYFNQLS